MVILTRLIPPEPGKTNYTTRHGYSQTAPTGPNGVTGPNGPCGPAGQSSSQRVYPQDHLKELLQWDMLVKPKRLIESAWWRWMPGVTFTVKWPVGWVVLNEMADGSKTSVASADPNDHYRPWMEKHVGRQGWDWQWGLRDDNAAENRLTIKIRNKHAKWATLAAIKWN